MNQLKQKITKRLFGEKKEKEKKNFLFFEFLFCQPIEPEVGTEIPESSSFSGQMLNLY
jgi:hypothetical protein